MNILLDSGRKSNLVVYQYECNTPLTGPIPMAGCETLNFLRNNVNITLVHFIPIILHRKQSGTLSKLFYFILALIEMF